VAAALPIVFLVILNGDTLSGRLNLLLASDTADAIRFSLWAGAWEMIWDAPLLGLGLGTFEDAYPMYASQVFPHVMDKAHCDYLEFAAGLGLPAACAWWSALVWLTGKNLRAIFVRRRRREFSVTAVGASVLVAVHSSVDFSLQLPAVALLYATLLSIGAAQCLSSNRQ
jgi:O-antigen ligase